MRETFKNKPFKTIVTYSFTNAQSEERDLFVELLVNLGFEKQDDQSTYALPKNQTSNDNVFYKIVDFCETKLKKDDIVDYYWFSEDKQGIEIVKFRHNLK